jgi:hypothetical protein
MPLVIVMNMVLHVRGRSNGRASRKDAWGAKLQGTVRGHWNNWKYYANKPLFTTCERISQTIFPGLALALKVFSNSVLCRKSIKNMDLKGRQIICLFWAPNL